MGDPVLHVMAGPNGAGKTTLFRRFIEPETHLELISADEIASTLEGDPDTVAFEALIKAEERRAALIEAGSSFATDTVFSHRSRLDLIRKAIESGYLVTLHVVAVPENLAVQRVSDRKKRGDYGGHDIPEDKIRSRYRRLWPLVAMAIEIVEESFVYDNTRPEEALILIASYRSGHLLSTPAWPDWIPSELMHAGFT
jgi:predicted ABC-type ATPase